MVDDKGTGSSGGLKDRPKDEKTAVAGGIAIGVVAILLIGWGFLFIKKIQKGSQLESFETGVQREFDFSSVRAAQEQIKENLDVTRDELRAIRDSAVQKDLPPDDFEFNDSSGGGQFGTPEDSPF